MADDIHELVSTQVTESFDLEFKVGLYGGTDAERRDLCADVASLANTAGGIIILGIEEDAQARARALRPVSLSDRETARMRQTVAAGVAPMPDIDIYPVSVDDQSGVYLIAVPRSPRAPHGVLVNDALRFPVRNGATTRYLSEPEVAAAYRERFAGTAARAARLQQVEDEVDERLDMGHAPWLVVSLCPEIPGDFLIDSGAFDQFRAQMLGKGAWDLRSSPIGTTFGRVNVKRGRLLADGTVSGLAKWVVADFHADGSAAYGLALAASRQMETPGGQQEREDVSIEDVVLGTITALRRAASHARDRVGAGGNATVRARLVANGSRPLALATVSHGFLEPVGERVLSTSVLPAETLASLDELADPGPQLVAVVARLVDQLAQSFGIPDLPLVSREGEFRLRYWSPAAHAAIAPWVERHGVQVIPS